MKKTLSLLITFLTLKPKVKKSYLLFLFLSIFLVEVIFNIPSKLLVNITIFLLLLTSQLFSQETLGQSAHKASLTLINIETITFVQTWILESWHPSLNQASLEYILFGVAILLSLLLSKFEMILFSKLESYMPILHDYIFIFTFIGFVLSQRQALLQDYITTAFRGIISFQLLLSLIIILLILLLIGMIIATHNQKQMQLINEIKAQDQIQEDYAKIVQDQYEEMRHFRHDYQNILFAIEGFIQQKKWPELEYFFYKELISKKQDSENHPKILAISRIANPLIQNFLHVKLTQGISKGIQVSIDVPEPVEIRQVNMLPLVRVLGCLIDNAIEAAQEHPDPQVHIAVMDIKDYEVIIIKNNYVNKINNIQALEKRGYSSKGQGRGQGLSIVKSIIKHHPIDLRTRIENQFFVQELIIH